MKKHLSILFLFLSITFSFAQNIPAKIYPKYDIANKNPLQTMLGANEVFTAGDFPVTVISAQGSNGIYSGTGYIVVPYLADTKVKVSFNNIKLNTDKKLIEGVVETTYDVGESNIVDGGLFDFLDKAITDNYTITNDAIRQGFFYQNSFDVIINNQTAINSIIAPYITNLTNLGLISTELKKQIEDEQKKQNDLLKGLDCPKKSDSENKGEGNKQQTEEPTKPKGSNDDVRVVETDCEKKLREYQQSQQLMLAYMKQAQQDAINKIINGQAFPPKYTEVGNGTPPKPITASRLREIQSHCEDGALGFWKAEGFTKVENNGNPYYYCLSGTEVFYHYKQPTDTYGYENYWFVDGNWYMEGTSQQCGSTPFNCFLVYDTVAKNYVLANLEVGQSSGEQAADFITWLFVRDMPLMIIGGSGGSIYEILVNGLGDPLISALNATDKITDEEALAAQITLALSGNVKHLTPENLAKIKTVLTSKFKIIAQKSGKNAKEIALELKNRIAVAIGKNGNILFNIGDEIVGISIKQIKKGTNGKYAIIGRSMGNAQITGVKDVYAELKNVKNLDAEIFDASSLQGIWKTKFDDAVAEFAEKTENWTKKLTNQELLQLKMYKLNKEWAQHLVDEGYTVLDMGDFNNLGFSAFYSIEKLTIFK